MNPHKDLSNFTRIFEMLESAVALEQAFTAWSVASDVWLASCSFADEWQPEHRGATQLHPTFDLASLTKPLFVPLWFKLKGVEASKLNLTLREVFQNSFWGSHLTCHVLKQSPLWDATVLQLMNHTAGLPSWIWTGKSAWSFSADDKSQVAALAHWKDTADKELPHWKNTLFRQIFLTSLSKPGSKGLPYSSASSLPASSLSASSMPASSLSAECYSDLGYMLLAMVAETGAMAEFFGWHEVIKFINSSCNSHFSHASLLKPHSDLNTHIPFFPYVSFEESSSNRISPQSGFVQLGSVHDTNANILALVSARAHCETNKLVSGHAGLFGNILDVEKCLPFLHAGHCRWTEEMHAIVLASKLQMHHSSCAENTLTQQRFIFGFDTPTSELSTAGVKNMSKLSKGEVLGHLGFTGTSLWFNSATQRHSLLTNRTASRNCFGGNVPRVAVVTSTSGTVLWCGVKEKTWREVSVDEYVATLQEHCGSRNLGWDQTILRSPPNISHIRREVAFASWNK